MAIMVIKHIIPAMKKQKNQSKQLNNIKTILSF